MGSPTVQRSNGTQRETLPSSSSHLRISLDSVLATQQPLACSPRGMKMTGGASKKQENWDWGRPELHTQLRTLFGISLALLSPSLYLYHSVSLSPLSVSLSPSFCLCLSVFLCLCLSLFFSIPPTCGSRCELSALYTALPLFHHCVCTLTI